VLYCFIGLYEFKKKKDLHVFIWLLLIDLLHILLSYKVLLWFHNMYTFITKFATL